MCKNLERLVKNVAKSMKIGFDVTDDCSSLDMSSGGASRLMISFAII